MAIIGGAGNPVGGSFTGPAEALEIVGNHCYAYSGIVTPTADNMTTYLKFTTGNFYSVVKVQFAYTLDANDDAVYQIVMNGVTLTQWLNTGSLQPHGPQEPMYIVIPAYTEFECNAYTKTTGRDQACTLTGRIYRE